MFGAFPGSSVVKNLPAKQDTCVQFLHREDPPEKEMAPLQYSCLGNPMDRGAWWATVHGVTKELDMTKQPKQQGKCNRSGKCYTNIEKNNKRAM